MLVCGKTGLKRVSMLLDVLQGPHIGLVSIVVERLQTRTSGLVVRCKAVCLQDIRKSGFLPDRVVPAAGLVVLAGAAALSVSCPRFRACEYLL